MALPKSKRSESVKKKSSPLAATKQLMRMQIAALKKQVNAKSAKPVYIGSGNLKVQVPLEKVFAFIEILENKNVGPETTDEILTTQEVADLLNVSRPYVIKLIENKELPLAFKAGTQRRIAKSAALAFKEKMRNQQNKALESLTEESEDLGLDF